MSKIRRSAKGMECQIRLQGICCYDNETTVLAHLGGGGIARKQDDLFGAFACVNCHRVVDSLPQGYRPMNEWQMEATIAFFQGVFRTQQILLEKGLIKKK